MEIVICIIIVIVLWYLNKWDKNNEKAKKEAIEKAIKDREEALRNAQYAYEIVLVELQNDPRNPNLKQEALRLGREYSNLCQDEQGNTIFDEVALMNDINAACAAASAANTPSVEERINTLNRLLTNGTINQVEYQQRKKQILDSL